MYNRYQNGHRDRKFECLRAYRVVQEVTVRQKYNSSVISGCYDKTFDQGTYVCIVCEQPLFNSTTKFDSGCGWPAFNDVLDQGKVKLLKDTSLGKLKHIMHSKL